mmetsp:Transcript_30495/g.81339  ORF Transcript_30495/g.81339 Transcript_30495/m.81339 type:complete len:142 (+) Transcript_30495:7976-8401(+)
MAGPLDAGDRIVHVAVRSVTRGILKGLGMMRAKVEALSPRLLMLLAVAETESLGGAVGLRVPPPDRQVVLAVKLDGVDGKTQALRLVQEAKLERVDVSSRVRVGNGGIVGQSVEISRGVAQGEHRRVLKAPLHLLQGETPQ